MAKSILQKKDGTCFLCSILRQDYSHKYTEEHHVIYGKGRRKLSERYGLKVHLCIEHHRVGPEAVHNNAEIRRLLEWTAQVVFEKKYGKAKWMEVFGENYLPEEEREEIRQEEQEPGFLILEEGSETETDDCYKKL